ncbi:MAG: 1-phosphofructokinase family hexose kinase [Christensenellaceae bacterium]|nr:1-phosphofructokinase family hexose kinase [Christensenellaceae bacterium]MEA5067977.1 1-phosphofructokinase family hexose kinase [Christensenellaceae bacterium]
MVTTVGINLSVDRGLVVERFQYGSMNRVAGSRTDAGGKAVNVAVVAAGLGLRARCVALLRKNNGRLFEDKLRRHGVESKCLWLPGSIRTNLKLLDAAQGVVTEINEPGEKVTDGQLKEMTGLILQASTDSDYLVLTGSLPPGCPKSYYAGIIRSLKGARCRCVLDAEGEALKAGIAACPYLIKPNRMELEMEVGHSLGSVAEVARAARALADRGIARVAVSLGAEGALLADEKSAYFAPGLRVKALSTVGAGDSMVAGMVSGLTEGLPTDEVLRRGAACATASVLEAGTRLADRAKCEAVIERITVERVRV